MLSQKTEDAVGRAALIDALLRWIKIDYTHHAKHIIKNEMGFDAEHDRIVNDRLCRIVFRGEAGYFVSCFHPHVNALPPMTKIYIHHEEMMERAEETGWTP